MSFIRDNPALLKAWRVVTPVSLICSEWTTC